jgi:F0F1-type ATP synthase assembly protein I
MTDSKFNAECWFMLVLVLLWCWIGTAETRASAGGAASAAFFATFISRKK